MFVFGVEAANTRSWQIGRWEGERPREPTYFPWLVLLRIGFHLQEKLGLAGTLALP